jgi:O-antigen/teichoic acid export membrane protein
LVFHSYQKEIKGVSGIKINHMTINGIWALFGNIFYAFTQWLTLIAIIKFGSLEMAGQYGYALALTAPIFLLLNLQLRGILATDHTKQATVNDYFTIRVITSIIALLICVFTAFFLNETIRLIILLVACCKMVESYSELLYGVLQKNEKMKNIAISRILRGVGSVLILSILLSNTQELFVALFGVLVVWISVLVFYDFIMCDTKIKMKKLALKNCKVIIRIGIPLGFVLMLTSLVENIPRYVIEHYYGTATLGIYTAIVYFKVAGNTLINAIGQSTAHRFSKYYVERKTVEFKRLLLKVVVFAGCIGIVGVLITLVLGKWLLSLFYSSSFEQYSSIFVIIMVASLFSYLASVFGTVMTSVRIVKAQSFIFIPVCILSLVVSILIIPVHGLMGASLVLLINAIVQLALSAVVTYQTLKRGAFI